MALTIEKASIRDLEKLYEIEIKCFEKEAFTKQQIHSLLANYNSIGLVAKINSEIVGFIIGMIYPERDSLIGHIITLDVSPLHRRKGIAERLLQEIEGLFKENNVKTCCLEVREDNTAALNLYRKLGYRRVGRLKNYYGDANGIYLEKDLT
ncbi:MAG: ribosomal protein S18-alanine N-acetyltransferase [Candidatus Bathyarchaeia archaeon]